MDPQDRANIIIALDQLVEAAIKDTVNNRDFDGLNLLDYVDNQTYDYDALVGTFARNDGLLVFGPYDLESLVGAGRSDLNLVIEPLVSDADETVKGFRVSLQDQNTVASSGLAMRQDIDNVFILELGEFSTVEEMENLFTQTSDIDGTTAKVSLVGDKLDEIFPNSEADIELVLSNEKPLISETVRQRVNRKFMPDYIAQAMDNLDNETAAQYSELAGDVDIPDTPEGAADAVNVTDEAENIFDDTLERLRNANDEFVNQQLDDVMAQKINEILPLVNTDLSKAEAVGIRVPPGGPDITTSKDPVLNAFADELGKYAMGDELNLSAKRKLWGFMWSAATNDKYGLINEKKSFIPELQDGVDASKLDNTGYLVWKNWQHSGSFRPQSLIGMTANEFDAFGPPPYVRLLDGLDKEHFKKTGEYLFQSKSVSEADVVIPEGIETDLVQGEFEKIFNESEDLPINEDVLKQQVGARQLGYGDNELEIIERTAFKEIMDDMDAKGINYSDVDIYSYIPEEERLSPYLIFMEDVRNKWYTDEFVDYLVKVSAAGAFETIGYNDLPFSPAAQIHEHALNISFRRGPEQFNDMLLTAIDADNPNGGLNPNKMKIKYINNIFPEGSYEATLKEENRKFWEDKGMTPKGEWLPEVAEQGIIRIVDSDGNVTYENFKGEPIPDDDPRLEQYKFDDMIAPMEAEAYKNAEGPEKWKMLLDKDIITEYQYQELLKGNDPFTPEGVDTPTNVVDEVAPLSDDVAQSTNKWTYENFAEKKQTADAVIYRELDDGTIEVLTIKRKNGPHRDMAALPGGIVEEQLTPEEISKAVIDPNTEKQRLHWFLEAEAKGTRPQGSALGENIIFAKTALREATEEVGLDTGKILYSQPLPVKNNRFDWDARAAQGVDVGGIAMIVENDWKPKAKSDAVSYEWIKIEDIASGERELAFGHTEFVRDSFESLNKGEFFEKTNYYLSRYGNSNYSLQQLLADLDTQANNSNKRNIELIKQVNEVRVQNGQPEIPLNNTKRFLQEEKLINAIGKVNQIQLGGNIYSVQEILKPDLVHEFLFDFKKDGENLDGINLSINDLDPKNPEDLERLNIFKAKEDKKFARAGLEGENQLSNDGILKVKKYLKEHATKKYRSYLKSLINAGLPAEFLLEDLLKNFENIVNSKEYNAILDHVISQGFIIDVFEDTIKVRGLSWSNANPYINVESVLWDVSNKYGQVSSLTGSVEKNIERVDTEFNEWSSALEGYDDIENPLKTITNNNREFVDNTVPSGVYDIPVEKVSPSKKAMDFLPVHLDTNTGVMRGITYHGGHGLSPRGVQLFKIFDEVFPGFRNLFINDFARERIFGIDLRDARVSVPRTFDEYINSVSSFLDTTTDLRELNSTINRMTNMGLLRGNVLYTTSDPVLSGDYANGGHSPETIMKKEKNTQDIIKDLLKNDSLYEIGEDPESPDYWKSKSEIKENKIQILNSKLKEIGLEIKTDGVFPELVSIFDTDEYGLGSLGLVDRSMLQINYQIPINSYLHADMNLSEQINNPKIEGAINSIIDNVNTDSVYTRQQHNQFVKWLTLLLDEYKKKADNYTDFNNIVNYLDENYINNLINTLKKLDDQGYETIKNVLKIYDEINIEVARKLTQGRELTWQKLIDNLNFGELYNTNRLIENKIGNVLNEGNVDLTKAVDRNGNQVVLYQSDFSGTGNARLGDVKFANDFNELYPDIPLGLSPDEKGIDVINEKIIDDYILSINLEDYGNTKTSKDIKLLQEFIKTKRNDPNFSKFFKINDNWLQSKFYKVTASNGSIKFLTNNFVELYATEIKKELERMNRYYTVHEAKIIDEFYNGDKSIIENFTKNYLDIENTFVDDIVKQFDLGKTESEILKILITHDVALDIIKSERTSTINALNHHGLADHIGLKSLSQNGIEVMIGTGGGRVGNGNEFHDTVYIIDPGDKFETGVNKNAVFEVKSYKPDFETVNLIQQLSQGNIRIDQLNVEQIKKVADFVPLATILESPNLTQENKIRLSAIYKTLNINDKRFYDVDTITPNSVQGPVLAAWADWREVIAASSVSGQADLVEVNNIIQNLSKNLFKQSADTNIPVSSFMTSTGLLGSLANGADMYDALVLAPVVLDLIGSRFQGEGQYTETIGGAVADVATRIYDPENIDTAFETAYGSPSTYNTDVRYIPDWGIFKPDVRGTYQTYQNPEGIAANVGNTINNTKQIIKDTASGTGKIIETGTGAPVNEWSANLWENIKKTGLEKLNNVADYFGMQEWIYNVKRDMFVEMAAKSDDPINNVKFNKEKYDYWTRYYEAQNPRDYLNSNVPKSNPGRR